MSEQGGMGRVSEAIGVPFPPSDLDPLAVALLDQLERMRSLDQLDVDDESLCLCFDVRWDR